MQFHPIVASYNPADLTVIENIENLPEYGFFLKQSGHLVPCYYKDGVISDCIVDAMNGSYTFEDNTYVTHANTYVLKSNDWDDLDTGEANGGDMDYMLDPSWYFLDLNNEISGNSVTVGRWYVKSVDLKKMHELLNEIENPDKTQFYQVDSALDLPPENFYWFSTQYQTMYKCTISESRGIRTYEGRGLSFAPSQFFIPNSQKGKSAPKELWSNTRTRELYFGKDYVLKNIRTRYAMFDRPSAGLQNPVLDSFFPKLVYQNFFDLERLRYDVAAIPKTAVAISPWVANLLGVRQMETEQMCRILGFTPRDIKTLILEVKRLRFNPQFVGYGGTGVNSIHWLTQLCKMSNTVNLFQTMSVFEPDEIEISNLLRFPKDITTVQYGKSSRTTVQYDRSSRLNKLALLTQEERKTLSREPTAVHRSKHRTHGNTLTGKTFTYGAPGLDYRHELSDAGNFISATHMGNSCSLYLNPTQDTDLQVESYGLIQLAPFFMNQLRMAIGLLEFLATDPDMSVKDTELMYHEFDGISKSTTDLQYNFQMVHSGLVSTPEEAANAV